MAFIVIAPGVRDMYPTSEAFAGRPLYETQPTARARRTPESDSEHQPTEQEMINRHSHAGHASHLYEQTAELPREREPAMLAEQIMTRPVVVLGPDATVQDAWGLFHRHHIRHIPIVGHDLRIAGILSERDLLRDAAGLGRPREAPHTHIRPLIMGRVITATPTTEIREIARLLYEQHIGAMPIINASDYPIGMVSRSDILRALVRHAPIRLWV